MIVDSHLHLFRNGYRGFRGASPLDGTSDVAAYEALAARHGISAGLVVCYQGDGGDPGNNAYVRELAASRPWIASVAYLALSSTLALSTVEALLGSGHSGIALYLPDAAAAAQLVAWPADIWERLGRSAAIVSLNARPEAIALLRPLVERAPGCAFLFAHLGLPGPGDASTPTAAAAARLRPLLQLASYRNVGVKLSGLYAIDPVPPHAGARPFMDLLLERFPPEHLHWGSDFSPALDFVQFDQTLMLPDLDEVPPADRQLILGESLARKILAARQTFDQY